MLYLHYLYILYIQIVKTIRHVCTTWYIVAVSQVTYYHDHLYAVTAVYDFTT